MTLLAAASAVVVLGWPAWPERRGRPAWPERHGRSMTLLAAASAVVVLGLVGVLSAFLWVIGTMVEHMASVLSEQVAPGAQAVAGHVTGMAPAVRQLDSAVAQLA